MEEFEHELKQLIVETLNLERAPDEIAADSPLFVEGLGLDSIDALEIALAIKKRYGVSAKANDSENLKIFASVRTLAAYISANRRTQEFP
jgi:acyl carrier protein